MTVELDGMAVGACKPCEHRHASRKSMGCRKSWLQKHGVVELSRASHPTHHPDSGGPPQRQGRRRSAGSVCSQSRPLHPLQCFSLASPWTQRGSPIGRVGRNGTIKENPPSRQKGRAAPARLQPSRQPSRAIHPPPHRSLRGIRRYVCASHLVRISGRPPQ
jgi:hypothetical protein